MKNKKNVKESTEEAEPNIETIMKESNQSSDPVVKTRLVTALQSLGRIGKSTLSQAILSWADYAGIATAALDADEEHQTLSGWYEGRAQFMPFRVRDDLLPIVDAAGEAPLELIDFPAQSTDAILQGFDDFGVLRTLKKRGVRLTVAIFASNERAGMLSAHKIITQLGNEVDYLLVSNPARFKSDDFDKSTIPSLIPNAHRIHLSAITSYTIQNIDAAGKKKRKSLTFEDAMDHVTEGSKSEIQAWLNSSFVQLEDAANVLLPDAGLIQNKVFRMAKKDKAKVSAFDL